MVVGYDGLSPGEKIHYSKIYHAILNGDGSVTLLGIFKMDIIERIPIFFVLDTSGSMDGQPISMLNHAMEEVLNILGNFAASNADALLKIGVLQFSSGAKWMQPKGLEEFGDFVYNPLTAGGLTDMGAALDELDQKLSRRSFLVSTTGRCKPIIIFMTDGQPTDPWEKALKNISENNKWYQNSIKIGFAVGDQANTSILSQIVGNSEGAKLKVRHAKAGEQFVTTHGTERSSGVFVSEKSLGSTPGERINRGALPHSNTAEFETKVELARDQNVIYGKIAPQSKFSKMDPKQQPRNGGGEQVITDGGYNSGAVRTKDPKYPVPAKQSIMQRANEHKAQHGMKTSTTSNRTNAAAYTRLKSKGQSRS